MNKIMVYGEKKEFEKAWDNLEMAEKLTTSAEGKETLSFNRKKLIKLINSEIQLQEFRGELNRFSQ